MAYRQLCAVTFAAIGLLSAACGGGPAGAAASSNNDRAPSNSDQPPGGTSKSDAAPTSATNDQAPISSETPPGTADAAAGSGSLGALCQELCTSLKNFTASCGAGSGDGTDEGDLCECKVPAGYPCGAEAAGAFRCLIGVLNGLTCTSAGSGAGAGNGNVPGNPNQAQPQQQSSLDDLCKAELDKANACGKAHGLETDSSGGGDTPQQHGCYPQGGCECDDPCTACTCKAGGSADKTQACFMTGGACAQ